MQRLSKQAMTSFSFDFGVNADSEFAREVLKTNAFDFPLTKSLEYVATFPVSMLERCQIYEGGMEDGTEVI